MRHTAIWQGFNLLQQKINGTQVHLWASIFCFIRHHLKWVERSYNSLISVVKLPTLVNGMFLCRWMTFDYTRFAASPLVWVQDWFNKNNIPGDLACAGNFTTNTRLWHYISEMSATISHMNPAVKFNKVRYKHNHITQREAVLIIR